MIAITQNAVEELANVIQELETLTSKPTLTNRDEKRHSFLLAKVALLKQGVSVTELRRFEQDRLLRELGEPRLPQTARRRTRMSEETEQEYRNFALGKDVRLTSVPPEREIRANQAGEQTIAFTQGPKGGYFAPEGFHDRAFEVMKQHDQIFDPLFSNIVETNTGTNMPYPSWDDASNSSVQVGEGVQSSEVDVANFGAIQLNSYTFRSGIVAVSLELLQDSGFPWADVLERVFAMRHARGVGQALISGSGVNAPTGLLTAVVASGAVPVIASGSSANTGGSETGKTTVGTPDLVACYQKLNPMYRRGACWYMADQTLEYLQGLLDKQGRPIVKFKSGLTGEYFDTPTILGRPVAICPSMPTMAASSNPIVFANPFYVIVRTVPSASYLRRFWESASLVLNGLVGFQSYFRVDSNLAAPNPNYLPAQFIQMHS